MEMIEAMDDGMRDHTLAAWPCVNDSYYAQCGDTFSCTLVPVLRGARACHGATSGSRDAAYNAQRGGPILRRAPFCATGFQDLGM